MIVAATYEGPSVDDIIAEAKAEIAALRGQSAEVDRKTLLLAHTYSEEQLEELPDQEWLVDGLIPTEGFGILWGASGTYKTFVALDLGKRLASGLHAWERRTQPATVLYMCGEGQKGIRKRLRAWRAAHPDAPWGNFQTCTYTPPLGEPDMLWAVAVAETAAVFNARLTIVDTTARHFGPGSENEPQAMNTFVSACTRIAQMTEGFVLGVHHSGHEQSRMRGHTALYGACDVVLGVSRPADGYVQFTNAHAKGGKSKDEEEMAEPISMRMEKFADSIVPMQIDASEVPSGIVGDAKPKEPRALSSDRMARISTVVAALSRAGGSISSTNQVAKEAGWRSYEKTEKALLEAARIGAVRCEKGPNNSKVWMLCEGWDL